MQAVLSLALVSGPLLSGAAFDELGVPAPYFMGAILAALAVPAVVASSRAGERPAMRPEAEIEAPEPAGVLEKT